ncbi:glycosyltransferase [bacterium]|nr:glycosyltransferase [bacterium]
MNRKVVIIHNIIAPYKVVLFNELSKIIPNMEVVFIAEKEKRRDWSIDYNKIKFPFTLLFKGSIDSINSFAIAKKTWRILETIRPDTSIICDYSNIFGWIALKWAKNNNNTLIFWLDSTYNDKKHYFPKEQLKHYFLNHFDVFLAPGEKTQHYLEYMKVERSKIITTGYSVNNKFFIGQYQLNKNKRDVLLNELKIKRNQNFIFIGRFATEKNIFTLLYSFLEVSKNNNEWGLILLGDGPLKNEINTFISKNNLQDKVILPGFIQQDKIVEYLIASDVFILPSFSEPWGLVVNEAMLCRLPVLVSTKCGCQPELVKEGYNGYSFDPYNKLRLIKIMQGFVNQNFDKKTMGEASFEIIKKHSPNLIAQNIVNGIKAYL